MHIVEMSLISKYFPVNNTQALDNMSLKVEQGEIHAVVGENGAGKSTLMKILHGIEKPDSGELRISGNTGMVSQHFKLIDSFSILDNIIMGSEPTKFGIFINRKKAYKNIKSILNKFNFKIDLKERVKNLSIGQKQLVEIIKVIYNDAQILIFDEPTAALSENEAQKLRKTILSLKSKGKTVIIISHKIADISSVSDRFTIIRKGKFIETVVTKEVNLKEISKHMSGEEIVETIINTNNSPGEEIFSFYFNGCNIKLHKNEIVGITGYGGCGLHNLEDQLEILSMTNRTIGYSPSNRLEKGVEINSSLKETLIAKDRHKFTKAGFISQKKANNYAKRLIKTFNIKGSLNCQTGTLSGGNLQKTVLARVLNNKPEIIILSSPTWGVDLESSNSIYREIDEFKRRGHGIILLSFDAEEVIKLSNTIHIMYKGKIVKTLANRGDIDIHTLGKLSSGIYDE